MPLKLRSKYKKIRAGNKPWVKKTIMHPNAKDNIIIPKKVQNIRKWLQLSHNFNSKHTKTFRNVRNIAETRK